MNIFYKIRYIFLFISGIVFFVYPTCVSAATYYFNNAINTNPTEIGNYWSDSMFSVPALQLPDFTVDQVNISNGSIFDNAGVPSHNPVIFNGNATNNGTVTGDAIFNENNSNNNGSILGTKTRKYTVSTTVYYRDFVTDGPWNIVADGAVIDISTCTIDSSTTRTAVNGGSLLYLKLLYSSIANNTLILTYNKNLITPIPSTSDFIVTVNGVSVPITQVDINSTAVMLTLGTSVSPSDSVRLLYTPGVNPITDSTYSPPAALDVIVPFSIVVGMGSYGQSSVGNKIYVNNTSSNSISIIDVLTNTVINTISVPSPNFSKIVGNKLYVSSATANFVSVIDLNTDTVFTTIPVGGGTDFSISAGNKLYVNKPATESVAIIDTNTDLLMNTISLGKSPYSSTLVGDKLYVHTLQGSGMINDYVSVIDTTTDTLLTNIVTGGTTFSLLFGTKLFVSGAFKIIIIDTLTDQIEDIIPVPSAGYLAKYNHNIYVPNSAGNELSVVDANARTVSTIFIGSPQGFATKVGEYIYVTLIGGGIAIINPLNNTLMNIVPTTGATFYFSENRKRFYVSSVGSVSVIDTTTIPSLLPNLMSFSTTASSGTYIPGQMIPITAHFGRLLQIGSSMTVRLNSGRNVTLDQVNGDTLSGVYVIQEGDSTPDLSVQSIIAAQVTDTNLHTRTQYELPSSVGNFLGENSVITRNLGDTKNIEISSYSKITTGQNPYQLTVVNGNIYVANQGSANVSVINKLSGVLTATISVGTEPYGLSTVDISGVTYIYVANTGSNTVSVINTATNTVVATIPVGVKPYYVTTVGTNIYVTNGASNTVSVINALTNTVTDVIPVGTYPRGIKAYGTNLYVANYGDANYSGGNSVSVVDTNTNTVTKTILLPWNADGPRGVNVFGSRIYITNYRSNTISIIDTTSNTIIDIITVGKGPRGILVYDGFIYVENFDEGTISIIDTQTSSVIKSLVVGHSPSGMTLTDTDILVSEFQDNNIHILDTTTKVLKSISSAQSTLSPVLSTTSGSIHTNNSILPHTSVSSIITSSSSEKNTFMSPIDGTSQQCHGFTHYLKLNSTKNPVAEVRLWQAFLNKFQKETIPLTGFYGPKTFSAIKRFQNTYKSEILVPWGLTEPTGYTYKTTRAKANALLGCLEGELLLDNGKTVDIK